MHAGRRPPALPRLTFLDLSTSRVTMADVSSLLRTLPRLRHLVLDHCGLLDGGADPSDWAVFAEHCLLAGDAQMLEHSLNTQLAEYGGAGPFLREVCVLPRALELRTLALSVPADLDADARRGLLDAFRRGWEKAAVVFNGSVCAARRRRGEVGVRTLRLPWPGEVCPALREHGLAGAMAVDDDDEFARLSVTRDGADCPVLCLAGQYGSEEGIEHAEGCGHSIGWDIWEDTL